MDSGYKKKYFVLFIFALNGFLPFKTLARTIKLPLLETKFELNKVRYLTIKGDIIYYQKNSGALAMVKNNRIEEIMSGPPFSQYIVTSSALKKNVIVEMYPTLLNANDIRKSGEIFRFNFGGKERSFLGKGRWSKLHPNDWGVTYYNYKTNTLHFNIFENNRSFSVKFTHKSYPYFYPEVIVLNKNEVLYSQINTYGKVGIVKLNHVAKKSEVVYLSESTNSKLEMCLLGNKLLIGSFSYVKNQKKSSISIIRISKKMKFNKANKLYEDQTFDRGHMICYQDQKVYFIKNYDHHQVSVPKVFDLASLDISGKLKRESFLNYVSNVILMDDRVLIPFRGRAYIVHSPDIQDKKTKKNPKG